MVNITEKDLKGQLEGFPVSIVEKMVANQVAQGNPANVRVFQNKVDASYNNGGFSWSKSPEGQFFWSKVINGRKFPEEERPVADLDVTQETEIPKSADMPVYKPGDVVKVNDGKGTVFKVIIGYFPEMPNPYLTITKKAFNAFLKGEITKSAVVVESMKEPERYVYLTLQDISDGKGVGIDPSLIRVLQ